MNNIIAMVQGESLNHYDQEQVELFCITPQHYSIFLNYLKINIKIITDPELFDRLVIQMARELNCLGLSKTSNEWIIIITDWKNRVKRKFENKTKNMKFTAEELELLNIITDDSACSDLTIQQMSCILDHLEIASDSPTLWSTIALEMEAFNVLGRSEDYWKKVFEKWCVRVKSKKKLLDNWDSENSHSDVKPNTLSVLESRLIDFLLKQNVVPVNAVSQLKILFANCCRICLETSTVEMIYIFNDIPEDLSFADKMNQCACIPKVERNDGLPQNICRNCIDLVENAYKFKILCERTDTQLRNMSNEGIKEETKEVLQQESLFEKNSNYEVLDFQSFNEEDNPDDDEDDDDDEEEEEEGIEEEELNEIKNAENSITKIEDKSKITTIERRRRKKIKLSERIVKDEDTTPHQCETCGIICKSTNALKIHRRSHSDVKPHQCNDCGKEFKTRLSLKIHIRSHTGERPYVCEICGKPFTQIGSLVYHRKIHLGIKNYECGLCDFRARSQHDLNIHIRKHTGQRNYQCTLCSRKYTTSSNLQKHLRRHSGKKDFKCDQCGRCFFSRESARKHMVTHTGLKPYSCTQCPMAYGWYNGLQKHMKMQHPGVKMPTEKSFFNDVLPAITN